MERSLALQTPRRSVAALATSIGLALAGTAHAEVLYDTTDMTDEQTYNQSTKSYIGGVTSSDHLGVPWDVQTSDDFTLDSTYTITSVTGDFRTTPLTGVAVPPAGGILVEFFADVGEIPSAVPAAAAFAATFASTSWADTVHGQGTGMGIRFTIDLSEFDIELGPGTWWVSITPVDETPKGTNYNQVRRSSLAIGTQFKVRNGGTHHGNGYAGPYSSTEWMNFPGPVFIAGGTLAMRIEGEVPSPSCPADFNESDEVNAADLAILLGAWSIPAREPGCAGSLPCLPDLNRDGLVNAADLALLLGAWGPCDS